MKGGHLGYHAPEGGISGPVPQRFFDRSCSEEAIKKALLARLSRIGASFEVPHEPGELWKERQVGGVEFAPPGL